MHGREATTTDPAAPYIVWGSELSPYTLKLGALLEYAGLPYRSLPAQGRRMENYRAVRRINRAKRDGNVVRHPKMTELDEYPLVPFLIERNGRVHYDSSALARWIDAYHKPHTGPLFPENDAQCFVAQLIDEAFDEFGLYMVHHNRWVVSAATNDAGERLAGEMKRVLLPGMGSGFARRFARRQVRRLPYLFSVAPDDFSAPVAPSLTPPSRSGFPDTHLLLDEAWENSLVAIERVLSAQPYLLGERFTVADASVYGQLGMNLKDRTAAEQIRERAPVTYRWLTAIRDGQHVGTRGPLRLDESLRPLLETIMQTFVPLMQQNEQAFVEARGSGANVFNEKAFDKGQALYYGEILGKPFRAVVKTFQVQVWRELEQTWSMLPAEARETVSRIIPGCDAFA